MAYSAVAEPASARSRCRIRGRGGLRVMVLQSGMRHDTVESFALAAPGSPLRGFAESRKQVVDCGEGESPNVGLLEDRHQERDNAEHDECGQNADA